MGIHGGTSGNDTLRGGPDNYEAANGTYTGVNHILGMAGNDLIYGDYGNDGLFGHDGNDTIHGRGGNDELTGDAGNDVLMGEEGNDAIQGGTGRDTMSGGSGQDTFVFRSLQDSGNSASNCDVITDFSRAQGDHIDISALSRSIEGSNKGFDFVETRPAIMRGEVSYDYHPELGGCMVYVNTNLERTPDFAILVQGVTSMSAGDFIF